MYTICTKSFSNSGCKICTCVCLCCPRWMIIEYLRNIRNHWRTYFMKSRMIETIFPLIIQVTVRPIKAITLGDVHPSATRWSKPGFFCENKQSSLYQTKVRRTCRIAATFFWLILKISLMSRDTVLCEGVTHCELRSRKMSRSSGSSTMTKGRLRRATHKASFMRCLAGVYLDPCENLCIVRASSESAGTHFCTCRVRLLVLSSWRILVILIDGRLVK